MTHQPLVAEGVVDAAQEEPEGPQVFKAELEEEVCGKHQQPYQQELQVHKGAGRGSQHYWYYKGR